MTTSQFILDLFYHVCVGYTVGSFMGYIVMRTTFPFNKSGSKSGLEKIEDTLHKDNAFQINFLMAATNRRITNIENQLARLKRISA